MKGSIASFNSHTKAANWCSSPTQGGQAFSAQNCNAFAYARVFLGCLSLTSSLAKWVPLWGRKTSQLMQWGAGGGSDCLPFPPALHLRELKGCPYLLGKVYRVLWVRTFQSSGHQVRASTWWECHLTHLSGLSKDSSGVEDQQDSSLHSPDSSAPYRNSCTQGSNSRGCPKSSSPDSSQEPAAFGFSLTGVGSGEGSSTLGSSKMTFF